MRLQKLDRERAPYRSPFPRLVEVRASETHCFPAVAVAVFVAVVVDGSAPRAWRPCETCFLSLDFFFFFFLFFFLLFLYLFSLSYVPVEKWKIDKRDSKCRPTRGTGQSVYTTQWEWSMCSLLSLSARVLGGCDHVRLSTG